MANTFKVTKLLEGPRHVILHVYVKSDGAQGDIQDQKLLDPAELVPPMAPLPDLTIEEIWWDLYGFGVRFEFNDLIDVPIWTISPGASNYIDLQKNLGGLVDRSGIDGNGILMISTYGLDNIAKQGTFIVKIRK